MKRWWNVGEKALLVPPAPLPQEFQDWKNSDWESNLNLGRLQEVTLGVAHRTNYGLGFFVRWAEGDDGTAWAHEDWLQPLPWAGGEYYPECGGVGRHRLGCPKLKPRSDETDS